MSSKIDGVPRELLERLQSQTELSNDWDEVQALLAAPVVERQEPVVIDLDAVDWETIQQAADESNWMPNEYMRNEWVADVCNFLKYGRADASPPASVSAVLPEPFAWYTEDHLTDKSATTYDVGVSVMWAVKGWPVTPLYTSQPAPVTVDEHQEPVVTVRGVTNRKNSVFSFLVHDNQALHIGTKLYISPPDPVTVSRDAERYQWLRSRDLEAIHEGGVFAGMTPRNVILNGDDLDAAIDACLDKVKELNQ